jgi:hypothetical protein
MSIEFIKPTKNVKARKAHVCNYCGCAIATGETYQTQTLKYDNIYVWKNHLKCAELVSELNIQGDEGVTSEDFYEHITEEFRQIWIKLDEEFFESKDFVIPSFKEQVEFVYSKRCLTA